MKLFHRIDDAEAIIRLKGGIYKQVPLYHRGDTVYVAAKGGYLRIVDKFGDEWGTSNPDVKVIDMTDLSDSLAAPSNKAPRYKK